MRPRKLKIAFIIWLLFFLLQRQQAMLLHQAYHFLVVEEEFRMRRRNQRRIMLMLFRQMSQNAPRRRRAWGWPRPQNWFRSLLANPALNFLWKEHFRVTRETFDYLCDLVRVNLQKQHMRDPAIPTRDSNVIPPGIPPKMRDLHVPPGILGGIHTSHPGS